MQLIHWKKNAKTSITWVLKACLEGLLYRTIISFSRWTKKIVSWSVHSLGGFNVVQYYWWFSGKLYTFHNTRMCPCYRVVDKAGQICHCPLFVYGQNNPSYICKAYITKYLTDNLIQEFTKDVNLIILVVR